MADSEVEMKSGFKLYLHTKLGRPHFQPELQAETTLVNFSVTQQVRHPQLKAHTAVRTQRHTQ